MFKISTPTLYSWIDKGLLDCCNLDLRNKVSRVRYGTSTVKRNTVKGHQLNGRSIENLPIEEKENRPLGVAEFDTVEGIKGGELIFTIMIPCFSLMLGFKIPFKTQEEVGKNELEVWEGHDFVCLHTYGYYGIFKPSVGEVLAQIRERDVPIVKAFEIIESPQTADDFYKDSFTSIAFDNGYHVSTVRLYVSKH